GLAPDWSIADDHVGRGLMQQAIDQMLREGSDATTRRLVHLLAKGTIPRGVARLMNDTVQAHFDVFRMTDERAWRRIDPGYPLGADELESLLVELEELEIPNHAKFREAHQSDVVACRVGDWEDFLGNGPAKKVREGALTYYNKPLPGPLVAVYSRLI